MRILVLAPHHDDETIGCGGTLAGLAAAGAEILVSHVFDGSTGIAGLTTAACREARRAEAAAAAAVLGCRLLPGLDMPDRTLHEPRSLIRPLIALLRRTCPALLLGPHAGDRDHEHRLVAAAMEEAFWMAASPMFPELGAPCPPLSALLGYEVWTPIGDPALAVDIAAGAERKRAALSCYASQDHASGWPAGAMGLSAYRGTTLLGGGIAEAFTLRRMRLGARELIDLFNLPGTVK